MKLTKRVSLNADKSLGYGHLLHCCGKYQPVHIEELKPGCWWECVECNKPLLLATEAGFYVIGEKVSM